MGYSPAIQEQEFKPTVDTGSRNWTVKYWKMLSGLIFHCFNFGTPVQKRHSAF